MTLLGLRNFLFNGIIIMSWITLFTWAITTALMSDGIIPKIQDFVSWIYVMVIPNLAILLVWTYRTMVMGKPAFFPIKEALE